jgi:hypothetical protein
MVGVAAEVVVFLDEEQAIAKATTDTGNRMCL